MPNENPGIPLADVLRAANELVSAGFIKITRSLRSTTPNLSQRMDADIMFIATDKTLSVGIPAIYSHLQSKGWQVEREHLLDFPVRFLAASGLTEEAVHNANSIEFEGVPAKVFSPEYIIAIAASVGRHKDRARIEQLLEQANIDKPLLDDILRRHNLNLPKK